MSKKDLDFTKGEIGRKLWIFSIPMLIGNLLQQIYFISDSAIVGKLIGSDALAAIGSATAITAILIFFFQGVSSGAGVIISHLIGGRNLEKIWGVVKASSLFTVIFGGLASFAGYVYARSIMALINVPNEIMDGASIYLEVAMLGIVPMIIYNMGSSILQAMGDSKTPIYYLAISSLINIFLDIFLIESFDMGVEAAALATVISQIFASVAVMISVRRKVSKLSDTEGDLVKDSSMDTKELINTTLNILKVGVPIGIQSVVINFSNVLVQNHINLIGPSAMAAWSIFSRVDTFAILPFISYRLAVMTFVGQNYGAGNRERILQGVRKGIMFATGITVAISFVLYLFADKIFMLFTTDKDVIFEASNMIYNMVPFYFMLAIAAVYCSSISGMGKTMVPMVINILFMCVIRIFLIPFFTDIVGRNMDALFYVYWISWVCTTVSSWGYYTFVAKKNLNHKFANKNLEIEHI